MKQKFIDIRTSKDGEIIDALCVNKASFEVRMSINFCFIIIMF